MKHHVVIEILAEDTQSLEEYLNEIKDLHNLNLALACKCGGYEYSEKAGENQITYKWRCSK